MAAYKDESVVIENTRLLFRNFKGAKGKYNKEGERSFSVVLEPKQAQDMIEMGWKVKWLKPREEGDEPTPFLPVKINFEGRRPPRIVLITSKNRTTLDEEDVSLVDFANIANVDLIVNPYHWNVDGDTGINAYLKSMFIIIEEDYLDRKYADVAESSVAEFDVDEEMEEEI
jgi:hypothetical protein